MIGLSETAIGSVASVLKSLRDLTDSVDSLPSRYKGSMIACRKLMGKAESRFFSDGGLAWRQMLDGSTEYSTKPTLLAPPENGGHSHIADIHMILADTLTKINIRKEELFDVTDLMAPTTSTTPSQPRTVSGAELEPQSAPGAPRERIFHSSMRL